MRIAKRTGLLLWVVASFLMLSYILDFEGSPLHASAIGWLAFPTALFVGAQWISDCLRRRLYAGMATAAMVAIACVFWMDLHEQRNYDAMRCAFLTETFEAYASRTLPGWAYRPDWEITTEICEGVVLANAEIQHKGTSYTVFASTGDWQDTQITLIPLIEGGNRPENMIRWPEASNGRR